ncbi:hypothetical protein KIW84_076177 [Lathyrus oleraceus]|uniref:MULE transposase domain-containing protein n=1 Tax=Pisum sativum TaxID=3888 RepID=A0A9D4VYY6_PEA|nr:hypothetical protein KIW84_076177 [Pisum sativum]
MENYDGFDSNDVHSTDGDTSDVELNDVEDENYSISSGYQSSDDGDDTDNIHNDDLVEVDAIVGFAIRKSDVRTRGHEDGDVASSLNYLNVKSSIDPMLYAEYAVDNDGRMKSVFWTDGSSRSDYFCFGDMVVFNTTYRKNKYNYPLVIFSGCNHHSQTIIFDAALVLDEMTETYKWLLRCFLECMEGKYPKAVVTDGDGAMREAIKQIFFPDATHQFCA